jgi:hypothetical protein
VINGGDQPDQLTAVAVGAERASLPRPVDVAPGTALRLGPDGAQVSLPGGLEPGTFVPLSMTFRDAGEFSAQVLVQDQDGVYGSVTPSVPPPPQPTVPAATAGATVTG